MTDREQANSEKRLSEDALAEHWYSLLHQAFAEMTQAYKASGLTQEQIAARLGRDPGFVSRCFSGRQNMTLRTISNIARAMGYRPKFVLERLSDLPPANHGHRIDSANGRDSP